MRSWSVAGLDYSVLIWNTLNHHLSNGRVEGTNTQLAALTSPASAPPPH